MINYKEERLKEIQAMVLRHGTGENLDDRLCIMQAVDYVASGSLSDYPSCACPFLTSYAIGLNDCWNEKDRQLLKPFIEKLIGTRDNETIVRAHLVIHRLITVILPLLTDHLKMPYDSAKLRSFQPGEWLAMKDFCNDLRPRIRKDAYAAAAADAYASAAAYAAADAAAAAAAAAYAAADIYAYAHSRSTFFLGSTTMSLAAMYAYAAAGALRDKTRDESLESLRLACKIRGQ